MSDQDFIVELFCRVDDSMTKVPKHSQAGLYPSEVMTLAILFVVKGVGNRAFYRWVARNFLALFPKLPERTRLFRLFVAHANWSDCFLAAPTLLAVADSYGIELIHPRREGRSEGQIGKKGLSNARWIVGGKLGFVLNNLGRIVGWDCATANVYDSYFHPRVAKLADQSVVLTDIGFHAQSGDPPNMKPCKRGTWNTRMMIETVLSMLTVVCHFKKVGHRVWRYFKARLAFTMAAFNILVDWHGPCADENDIVHMSIAEFSL